MSSKPNRIVKTIACCVLLAAGWLAGASVPSLFAQGKNEPPATLKPNDDRNVVAYVNGIPITRQELGDELIARKGKEQLELLINRRIIEHACKEVKVSVTDQEVYDDLMDVATKFGCRTLAEFERTTLRDKKVSLHEYKEDVVRPALMIKKLAGKRAEPTEDELKKAFEANFGEKIQCRMILETKKGLAQQMWQKVNGLPEATFIEVAKTQVDPRLASGGGMVAPINKHSGLGVVEEAAFRLKDGQISELLETPEGFVILYRKGVVPPKKDVKFEEVRDMLFKDIHDKKLALDAPKLFKELKQKAEVRDYLNYKQDFMDVSTKVDKAKNPVLPVKLPEQSPEAPPEVPATPGKTIPGKG